MFDSNKKISKILVGLIVCVFAFSVFSVPAEILAEENAETATEVTEQQPEEVENTDGDDDGEQEAFEYEEQADSWRYQDGHFVQQTNKMAFGSKARASYSPWSEVNGKFVNDEGKVIKGAVRKGIDVSVWQGNINWSKVKASGIDFAIIRCGYGSNKKENDDSKWERNVSECERLGIPYGVYIYSYANSVSDAKSEAQHVLRLLKGHNPEYPVYYDLEDKTVSAAGRSTIIKMASTFCSTIENNGYRAGIYANLDWWNNKLNSSSLNKYEKWIAQWNSECTYKGDYRLWQCTSSGSVSGISGRVDINFEFWKEDTAVDVKDYDIILTAYRNVRTGPHTAFEVVDSLSAGETVTITHEAGNWGKIKGSGNWVQLLESEELRDVADYQIILTSDRNIRTGPKTTFEKTDYYEAGTELTITHKAGNWGKIEGSDDWVELLASKKIQNVTDYQVILTEGRNIRTGPSSSFDKVDYHKAGTELTITYKSGSWGKIEGTNYWVELLASQKIKNVTDYQVILTSGRNIRTGPSSGFEKVDYHKAGTELMITHEAGNWGKLEKTENWVELSVSQKIQDVDDYQVILTAGMNIRTGPKTTFKKVDFYNAGKELAITHKSENWGKIEENGNWVKLSASQKIQDVDDYQVILTAGMNIRTGPKTTFKKVDFYNAGRELTITHKSENWGKIKGKDNWVKLSASQKLQDVEDYKIILTAGRNVRTGPKTTFRKVGYYKAGTELTITHKAGNWGKIEGSDNWVELLASEPV